MASRGFILIFNPAPKERHGKLLPEPLKMTILGPCLKIPPCRVMLIVTPDPAKLARVRLEIYSLGLFGNPPSRGLILIFTPGPNESYDKVLHEQLKMTISGPCDETPQRGLKFIFTPVAAKPASLRVEIYSMGLFGKMASRGFILIFTPAPKERHGKLLHEPLKLTISGPCVKISPRRLKLIFTPDPAKPASLRLEIYSLGLFGKMASRGFILIFTPVPNESYGKVLHEQLKMTISGPCDETPSRGLKLIFTPVAAKPASLRLEIYSLGHFGKMASPGFILIFTPAPKERHGKLLHEPLKMTILGHCLEIPPCRVMLILTPDPAKLARVRLEIYRLDPAKPASLRLEIYSLGLFGNPPSRGLILIFTPGPNESYDKVLHEQLKMTISGPCDETPQRGLKFIFTPVAAKPASLRVEIYSMGLFGKMASRGFILIFTPAPKERHGKLLHEPLKLTISGPCVKISPRRLKLIFTPDPAKPASLRLEIYSLGLFGKMASRGFILIFTPVPNESYGKVLHEQLKMTISGPCDETPSRGLKLIFTPVAAKPASLRLEIYSLGHFGKMASPGFILIFTPAPKERHGKLLHEPLKMTILGHCLEIPPCRVMLIVTPDPAKLARVRLEIYSLGLFGNLPSRGLILIFTPGPNESYDKVLHEQLKMTISGPCDETPQRGLKFIFTPVAAKPASLRVEIYSMGLFGKMASRGFILIFTPAPKERHGKLLHEPLKLTISGPCVKISPRRLKLIFTPDPAKPASLRLEIYSLGLFGKMASRGFILIFTPVPNESYGKVLHEQLKMTISGPCDETPSRGLKLIFTPVAAKPASLRLEIYSLGHFGKMASPGFILIFTPAPKERHGKLLHEPLKMTILGHCLEIPPCRVMLILTPDPAKLARVRLEIYRLDPAKPASLRLEIYSLGLFGNPPSRGLILIFTPGPNESYDKVLHEQLKMTISGPCDETPQRGLKFIFTPVAAKPASLRVEIYSMGLFGKMASRGFILIFTPAPKERHGKLLHEPLKLTISGPCVKISPRRLKLIFTPDPAKPASLRLEIYSLGLFGKMASRGFILIFTPVPNESYGKVLHEQLKMTISGPCDETPSRGLKLIFTPVAAKPASLRLEIYSLGHFGKMASPGFILIFTPAPKERHGKLLHEPLKMTILGHCLEIPPCRVMLIVTPDPAKLARVRLEIYSLGLFGNLPSRGLILIFTPGPNESYDKVLHEQLKMTISGPCDETPQRGLKFIFTPVAAKPASLRVEIYSMGLFGKMASRGFILIFTPAPKERHGKLLHEPLKLTISGPCVKISPRRLKLIFTPDPAKPASLRLEIYSLGLFGKMASRGFILIFTPVPNESYGKVLHEQLKMTISGPCDETPSRGLKLIFTPVAAKPASLRLEIYSLGHFGKMASPGFILIFTPAPKERHGKLLHEPLKMTILGHCLEIPPCRVMLILTPDPAKLARLIFTPDPAKLASLRLEIYSLGLFGNPPSRGLILIFTPGPNESYDKVLHEQLKMTISGPCDETPQRGLKFIFTPVAAKPASLRVEIYSMGLFGKMASRGFILIFTPAPKERHGKLLHEPLKLTISGPCVKISPRRLKLIFTPDPAKPASLRLEIYSLGLFGKMASRGFILIFTPVPNESYGKVLHEQLKMTISGPCDETPSRGLKLIFTPVAAKPASLRLEIYSLGHFGKMASPGFILIFTPAPKERHGKLLHEPLKMTILGHCLEIPPCRVMLILTPDPAKLARLIFTPDPAKPASLRLEIYSLGLFGKMASRGFILIFTPGRNESYGEVLHEQLKMTISGPCDETPSHGLKLIFTPVAAKPNSLRLEIYSLGLFGKIASRGFILIFTPGPNESYAKVLHEQLKKTISGPCDETPSRGLKLIFTPVAAKPASLRLEIYSLGLFGKMASRGFILIFTLAPKERHGKLLHEPLKMTILGPCLKIPPCRVRLILTPDPAKLARVTLEIYSLGLFGSPPSRGLILIFTPGLKQSYC
ncbi:hypothetical protein ACROYT_G030144 [Oculina patagonica]